MKWIVVRQGSSASAGTWDYMQVPDHCKNAQDVEEYMDDNHMLNNWSEHYRGIEVKFIRKVPQAVIDERIKSAKSRIEYAKAELKELQAMEPSKTDIRVIERRKRQRKMNKIYKEKGLTNLIQPIE